MIKKFRWWKATDINCDFATFELMADEEAILDIGFSDARTLEISFNHSISGKHIEWNQLKALIEDGKKLAERDQ